MVPRVVSKTISKKVDAGDEVDVGPNQLCFGNHLIALFEKNCPQCVIMSSLL